MDAATALNAWSALDDRSIAGRDRADEGQTAHRTALAANLSDTAPTSNEEDTPPRDTESEAPLTEEAVEPVPEMDGPADAPLVPQLSVADAAEEGTPPADAALVAELSGMRLRALMKRAEEMGIGEDELDQAAEADLGNSVRRVIVARVRDEQLRDEQLRDDLEQQVTLEQREIDLLSRSSEQDLEQSEIEVAKDTSATQVALEKVGLQAFCAVLCDFWPLF